MSSRFSGNGVIEFSVFRFPVVSAIFRAMFQSLRICNDNLAAALPSGYY
jgi:hypothetical protein